MWYRESTESRASRVGAFDIGEQSGMPRTRLIARASGKVRRMLASRFERRVASTESVGPIVSFSFDDAPRSAFGVGREILEQFGARATYFVSLGLLDKETEVGTIASVDDLSRAVSGGCELGCHTFDHLDAWSTSPKEYMESVIRNRDALRQVLPRTEFAAFAYPKSGATVWIKPALSKLFACCRGGGQATNAGVVDLNLLNACFIDRWTGIDLEFIRKLVSDNSARRGWLIFVTHDVAPVPSPYGCSPDFLEAVARYASETGALLLPVGEACARLRYANESSGSNHDSFRRA